jgi:hypothetical protein
VVGRRVFYNSSYYDTNNGSGTFGCNRYIACGGVSNCGLVCTDDTAIASDKTAARTGTGLTTYANYISYSKGINGIMVDIAGRSGCGDLTATDFDFVNTGHDGPGLQGPVVSQTPDVPAAAPSSVTTRAGEGQGGSDRVVIIWDNTDGATGGVSFPNNKNSWLEINVLAGGNTGLASMDTFYFGIAQGEGNIGNTTAAFPIGAGDITGPRDCATQGVGACGNPLTNPKPISEPFDYNKDGIIAQASDGDVAISNPAGNTFHAALRSFVP